MNDKKQFTISELASSLEISPSTIRFYEEKKLIKPARTSGNQRIYTRKDRARLKLILRGKRFGFSLDEIAEIIGFWDVEVNEKSQIQKSLSYTDKRIEEVRLRRNELDLLEEDMRAMRTHLLNRLKELEQEERGSIK
ncbi:MAG: MerR family DNA-binding transcriptional regulator [Proteobacteria bacterium]|nr:MerR family DNA-binding transcriptional regulator [Pseudomonadota bacterium]